MRLSIETWKGMLESASNALRANRAFLSKLDAAVGDGDHGETMVRIADKIDDTRMSFKGDCIPALFEAIGDDLMGVPGGSSTTLYAAFFTGLAQEGSEVLEMFSGALAALQEVSGAQRGDRVAVLQISVPQHHQPIPGNQVFGACFFEHGDRAAQITGGIGILARLLP